MILHAKSTIRFRKPLLYPAELRDHPGGLLDMSPIACVPSATAVVFAAAFTAACCLHASAQQAPAPICGADEIARATVSRVSDGRTFTLADGREVRLAGIEAPPLPAPQESSQESSQNSA